MSSRLFQRLNNVRRQGPSTTALRASPYIKVEGLPRSITTGDLRRLCVKSKVENVANIGIDYHRFAPTGTAYIALTQSDFVPSAVKNLRGSILGGLRVKANHSVPPDVQRRSRGVKGRAEAAERGLVTGEGLGAGVASCGKSVVVYGLPGKMTVDAMKAFLKIFNLAETDNGEQSVVKIEPTPGVFTLISKFLVRAANESEAQRIVRKVHNTLFQSDIWGDKYQVKARVLY
ncbi:hypothetical protein C8Q75DRAFT_801839 [Abortiporus biennis]|nr:hypothetical protein C8Q75DRAFT_801839 [Abortiporus biennis]